MRGRIKFFDVVKGIGFVYFDDGSSDAFLHVSLLNSLDRESLLPETGIEADVAVEKGRRKVVRIRDIDESTVTEAAKRTHVRRQNRQPPESLMTATLTVKLFDAVRGFGFFQGGDDFGDVFVHVTVARSAGRESLAVGESYEVDVARSERGLVAQAIRTVAP